MIFLIDLISNQFIILLGPSSPIIEDLRSFRNGLDISWKSDILSRQEKYVVKYVRNDTGRPITINTTQPRARLPNLYPGAGYVIKVFALSHGLLSEPHESFTAAYPNPPSNLIVEKVRGNKVTLKWNPPQDSLYTGYIIRYRPEPRESRQPRSWTEIPDINDTEYTLNDLLHGEQYEIEVDSVSHRVLSGVPLSIIQIIEPEAIEAIVPLLDAENVTLTWPRPTGRVDFYHIKWHRLSNPDDIRTKDIPGYNLADDFEILIEGLHPGVEYLFEITTEAHNLLSETTRKSVRTMPLITSEITVINQPEVTTALTLRYTPTPLTSSLFDTYRYDIRFDFLRFY